MPAPSDPNLFIETRADGRRVFHLGKPIPPLPQDGDMTKCYHLGAYSDGALSVPAHWWNAQVTDRTNCPIVLRRSPAQLVAANRMFAYGNTGCKVPVQPLRVPYTPMGSSNIAIYMPGVGERQDIGLITDNGAYYMLGGNSAPMIDWAQAAGSCPMHFRDDTTGKPIDLLKYPTANAFDLPGYQGSPFLPKGPPNTDPKLAVYSQFGGGWHPQQAHYCEMSYVAFQATQDMGFLEDLQYSANFTVLCSAELTARLKALGLKGPVPHGEYRGVAWALRNLFMAHVATLDAEAAGTLPAECHPSSYWKTLLDQSLAYYSLSMTNPARQAFRIVSDLVNAGNPSVPAMALYQVDYMLTALAFGVLTGHSDWTPLYLWALKNAIDRTSGDSDYPPGYGVAYYLNGSAPDWKTAIINGIPGLGGAEGATATELAKLAADPLNGGVALRGRDYLMETRAALVMAQYLDAKGLAGVKAVYPKLDTCVANVDRMLRATKNAAGQTIVPYMNPRAAVVLDASQAPTTTPPLPPPTTPPPATGGAMTTIIQGSSYILTPRVTTPAGAIGYGVKPGSWTLDKTNDATLTPAAGEQSATLKAKVDTSAEDLNVACLMFVDAAKTKTISISITLTDVLVEATGGVIDVAPAPGG